MAIYLSSTTLLIAFSICLLIIIVFCNFALIFCKRFSCSVEDNEYNINFARNNLSRNINNQNNQFLTSINIQDLSEIAPIVKYNTLTNKPHEVINNTYSKSVSVSPTLSNSANTQKSKYGYSCVICLNNICDEDLVRSLPCKHIYHFNCIDEWVKIKSICPLCNRNIKLLFDQVKHNMMWNTHNSPNRVQSHEENEYSTGDETEIQSPSNLLITTFNVLIHK